MTNFELIKNILFVFMFFNLFISSLCAKNYVKNPSFETVGTNGWASNWSGGQYCEIVTSTFNSGKNSVHCKAENGHGAGFYQTTKDLFLGVKYKASAYIKTKGIVDGSILFYVESGNYIYGVYLYSNGVAGCEKGNCYDKWYKIEGTSVMNFGNSSWYGFGFDLRPSGKATGEFWVDDVSLEIVETDILSSITVKSYRSEVYEDPVEVLVNLKTRYTVFENGEHFTLKVTVEDEDNSKKIYQTLKDYEIIKTENNVYAKFIWDPDDLPENKMYVLRATTVNSLFSNKTEETTTWSKKLDHKPKYKFYFDENNVAWMDGKKFFPIGLYFQSSKDEDLDYLKGSAFNLVKIPTSNKNTIEKIHSYTNGQIYVINGLGVKYSDKTDKQSLKDIRNQTITQINKVKDAKGLIGYYIADEPPNSYMRSIREATLTIREYDGDKFAFPALLRTQYWHQWKEIFDVGGIDCYPVQTYEALQDIWVITYRARDLVVDSKPIWGIPQFFTWELYDTPAGPPPTEQQLRQMTYQFIVAGAKGLIYYDFHEMKASNEKYPFDKEWKKIRIVTDELKEKYVPIIISDTKTNPNYLIPKFDDVDGANYFGRKVFRYDGYDYILIVNVRNQACKTTIKTPESVKSVEKLMGSAKMTVSGVNVTLEMPSADVVWLKCYDSDFNPEGSKVWVVLLVLSIIILIAVGVFFFLRWRGMKKLSDLKNIGSLLRN